MNHCTLPATGCLPPGRRYGTKRIEFHYIRTTIMDTETVKVLSVNTVQQRNNGAAKVKQTDLITAKDVERQ